jgi:glutamyl-Q tRNA(Asp) synthetase
MQDDKAGQDVLRFAPSPNGWLHLGHAYSALFAHEMAQRLGARFLLRIEDIDIGRCRPEYEEAIYEDLRWLGIDWEEPVRRQSEHFADYERHLKRLRDMGLVYPCFATRKEIQDAIIATGIPLQNWPVDPDGAPLYPGIYKDISRERLNDLLWDGRSYAWRLDTEKARAEAERIAGGPITFIEEGESPRGHKGRITVQPELFGDVVIARKDVPTSYHLAVVTDDALQGVTPHPAGAAGPARATLSPSRPYPRRDRPPPLQKRQGYGAARAAGRWPQPAGHSPHDRPLTITPPARLAQKMLREAEHGPFFPKRDETVPFQAAEPPKWRQ